MDEWNFIADRKIRDAMEEGAFDDLEGTGRPLDLRDDPFVDPSLRMAHRLLKNNGFAPAWIEDAREIDAETRRLGEPSARARADYESRVTALNRRIADFNLKAPAVSLHKPLFGK